MKCLHPVERVKVIIPRDTGHWTAGCLGCGATWMRGNEPIPASVVQAVKTSAKFVRLSASVFAALQLPDQEDDRMMTAEEKARLREALDLSTAEWTRGEPDGVTIPDAIEYAHVPHTDGVTYTVVRQPTDPNAILLIFTPSEWDAWVKGVKDGEFDLPEPS